jgi:SAM-dependent methyltransferase
MTNAGRNAREREFFNRQGTTRQPSSLDRFYDCHAAHRVYFERVLAGCRGKTALEYGCGAGLAAFRLATEGARVAGIDISDVAIAQAKDEAARRGLSIEFRVGDAESMPFGDASFDIVCGSGILHHLHIPAALAEVARVLKPDGRAVFIEPLGHNPLVSVFRALTPGLRTVDEHPLVRADLAAFGERFHDVRAHYFDLLSLFAIPLLRFAGGTAAFRLLEKADAALFAALPFMRPHAGFVVLEAALPCSARRT